MDKIVAAAESSLRRDDTSVSVSSSNPLSELRPSGVAGDGQSISDALTNLVSVGVRIADAVETEHRSLVKGLPPEALSYEDAARFMGVDVPSIKELVRSRKLPYVQYGTQRGRMLLIKDLRDFLSKHRQMSCEEMLSMKHRA